MSAQLNIVTVVGARPQFIKAAAMSRVLRSQHTETLIHTGQHYDDDMSQVFFDELDIPSPDVSLNAGGGSHAEQTSRMMTGIEQVLQSCRPDVLLAYGDTNSTLAAALAASKLHIPVAHVEAGLRSFNRRMPEEVNRVVTDHLSAFLLCPSETAVNNLAREGISTGVCVVGDIMADALFFAASRLRNRTVATIYSQLSIVLKIQMITPAFPKSLRHFRTSGHLSYFRFIRALATVFQRQA